MAKTYNHIFIDDKNLQEFLRNEGLNAYSDILVQIYAGKCDVELITSITSILKEHLPLAVVVGCTTAGEVADGSIYEDEILLSVTIFEKTKIDSMILKCSDFLSSKDMGRVIAQRMGRNDSKLIFLFTAGNEVDASKVIAGIKERCKEVVIAGGSASSSRANEKTLVFQNDEFVENGVVVITLNNENLLVNTYQNQKWSSIGETFTITKAKENIISSINGTKPIDFLHKYLGIFFTKELPMSSSDYPFIISGEHGHSAVFINRILPNGSIEMSQSVRVNDVFAISHVPLKELLSLSEKMLKQMAKQPIDSIFMFHNDARKHLLRQLTKQELASIHEIGQHSGFFSNSGRPHVKFDEESKDSMRMNAIVAFSEQASVQNQKTTSLPLNNNDMKPLVIFEQLMQATVKDLKQRNQELQVSEQHFKSLFQNNADFVYSTDLQGCITQVNDSFLNIFQYPIEEVVGNSILKFVIEEERPQVRSFFNKTIKGKMHSYQLPLRKKNGVVEHFLVKNIPIIIHGQIVGIHATGRNITEQISIENQLIKLAYYDAHTGLPNRIKFTELLVKHIKRAKKKKRELAVVIIDIDRFKHINDSIGYYSDDLVIKQIADRIKAVIPLGTYIGHLSGDKFTLILTKNVNISEVERVIQEVVASITKPILFNTQEFFVTASIGISMSPGDGMDAESLMKHADIAMNRVKILGGDNILFFDNEMIEQAKHRTELESSLRKAIKNEEFFLCYQPLLDLQNDQLYGSEALIRWEHPEQGIIPPSLFIPLAEETGLIKEIGLWVLQTACKQNRKWHDLGFDDLVISVNVSAHQFQQPQFVQQVQKALDDAELEAKYLRLELTESVMVTNMNHSIAIMNELQKIGVKISIDDFGTGYSSLSYLKNFPIDYLKIDRSFINNLDEHNSDNAIVKAIITMGHGLSLKIVAEGVETKEQMSLLKLMKCHFVQGYYINKPLIPSEFEIQARERLLAK